MPETGGSCAGSTRGWSRSATSPSRPMGSSSPSWEAGPCPIGTSWVAQLTFLDVATGRLVRRGEWDLQESERQARLRPRWQDGRDRDRRRDPPALGCRHRETLAPGTPGRSDRSSRIDRVLARRREPPAGDRLRPSHPPLGRGSPPRGEEDRDRGRARNSVARDRRPIGRVLARWNEPGRGDQDSRGGNPALEGQRRYLAQALQEPEEHVRQSDLLFARRKAPRRGGVSTARWCSLTSGAGRSWTRSGRNSTWWGTLCRATARWRSRPTAGRSRPSAADRPSTSGTWRRARTAWPLPKPIWAASTPSHSPPTARRSSPAATTEPSGSGTWRRGDRRRRSPTTAGSGRSRSPPMGRSSPRAWPTRERRPSLEPQDGRAAPYLAGRRPVEARPCGV